MTTVAAADRFGNPIDPAVRYARGNILRGSEDESRRLVHGNALIRQRVAEHGPDSVLVFTGNQRDFPLGPGDLGPSTEEWVGSALLAARAAELVRNHLAAPPEAQVALFNRSSAGIIAAVSALATEGSTLLSFAPPGGAHASVRRGAWVARAKVLEVESISELEEAIATHSPPLVVITPVSSELEMLDTSAIQAAVEVCQRHGAVTFLDDAYGARLRPIIFDGPRSMDLGVDLAISNSDKAGLEGPRGGYMAGRTDLVVRVQARAGEFGQEARAPIAMGIIRSLERWHPDHLLIEVRAGGDLARAVEARIGSSRVVRTVLGPMVNEEDVLDLALERAGLTPEQISVVPAEASSALGMILLERWGVLTVNVAGQPGARVSLRLKPTASSLDQFGGAEKMAEAVDEGLTLLADAIGDTDRLRQIILGTNQRI